MYNVSNDYKTEINNAVRNPTHVRVKFGIIDPDAQSDAVLTTTSETVYSNASAVKYDDDIEFNYDTLEFNKFILDRSHKLATPSYGAYQGYVSNVMSDNDCVFATPPQLIVNYTGYYTFAGLSLTFDKVRKSFASEFNIKCFLDETLVYDNTIQNVVSDFIIETDIPLHNKLVVTFNKSDVPYSRIRLSYLGFGIYKTITDSEIQSTEQKRNSDILSTVLPVNDFSFTFLDVNNEYNPDNSTGLYKYMESLQPIKFEYGYELNSGIIEWVLGGNNYSDGTVSIDSHGVIPKVTFKSSNSLLMLKPVCTKGVYNPSGVSLYDMAVDVISDFPLEYEFDDYLKTIVTFAPIPKLPTKEVLQLIANCGQCYLDVDREGKVIIKKLDMNLITTDFKFDFNNMYDIPIINKYPPLKNLTSYFHEYIVNVDSENISTISIDVAVDTEYVFEYELATDVSMSVDGTLVIIGSPEYFGRNLKVTLNGTGKVTITGKKITVNTSSSVVSNEINGEDAEISNELITNHVDLENYMNWVVSILSLRNEYTFDNRGYCELDPLDNILLDTLYSNNLRTFVIENNIKYNGALSGSSKVLIND